MKTKLLENIEAKLTGKFKYVPGRMHNITYEESRLTVTEEIELGIAVECKVGVDLGCNVYISDTELKESDGKVLDEVKLSMGQAIADHVYGDIRNKLVELNKNLRGRYTPGDEDTISIVNEVLEMIEYDG